MSEVELTEKQQQVLEMHRANKGPAEIAEALGISTQGVHGHIKRLRNKGLIEAKPSAGASRPARRDGARLDPKAALEVVREAARQQITTVEARQAEIEAEIKDLQEEKRELGKTLTELRKHSGEEGS